MTLRYGDLDFVDLLEQLYEERKNYKLNTTSQHFWSKPHRSYNPQPRSFQVGDKVRKKGDMQIMEITFVKDGVAICKWFDMNGYTMVETFDIDDLEHVTQSSTFEKDDDHDCVESKKKGWCGEYCEQARKGKCPEGIQAKFPY